MRKFSILLVLVLVLCCLMTSTVTASASDAGSITIDSSYASSVLEDFITANPSRVYDTSGELSAGVYIYNYFDNIGLDVQCSLLSSSDKSSGGNGNSYNIIATIDTASTDDTIIIGAHYDALYEGATDNGTGVTALLLIAEQLYALRDSLQCDIVLIAFAGEEQGLLGSYDYVSNMSDSDIANTKLMINIDSIGLGDELFVYGELTTTDYIDVLIEGASSSSSQLDYKPLYAGLDFTWDYYGYGYYERVQGSDHTPFALEGIATAFYFSGSFNTLTGSYVESTNAENCVMNTSSDTLYHLTNSGVDYASRIVTVVESVTNAIQDDTATLLDAPNQLVSDGWFNYTAVTYTYYAVAIVAIIVAIVYYKKLARKAIIAGASGGISAGTTKRVFTKPDAEDIFDIGD